MKLSAFKKKEIDYVCAESIKVVGRPWNALPTDIKRAATLLTFKKKL